MGKNNSDNSTKDDVIEIAGKEFHRVKNGLDENEVGPLINDIIDERDALLRREEHLSSLTKLAEKTITEADKLAEEIKAETMKQAEADAVEVVARAEEQAKKEIEEKRTEVINTANNEAAAIKEEAKRDAELIMENQKKKIKPEIREFVKQISSQMLSELERINRQVEILESELEEKLLQFDDETEDKTEWFGKGAAEVLKEEDYKIPDDFTDPIHITDNVDTHDPEEKMALFADNLNIDSDDTEPQWELEILPPMDIMKVMSVVTHLDGLPEVEKTEIIPRSDKPSIMVFLNEPIQLNDIIREFPEVVNVTEEKTDDDSSPKRLQLSLTGAKTVTQ